MAALDWKILTEVYRKIPSEQLFLKDKFGKNVIYSPVPKVNVRIENRAMSIATLGKVGDPAKPVNVATNVNEMDLTPAQIFEYDLITEADVFSNANPEVLVLNGAQTVANNMQYIRAQKIATLKNRVGRRIEQMIANMLSDGKIVYNDGSRNWSVDFGVTPESYTLSSTTNILADLLDLTDEMRKAGANPDTIIITKDVEKALFNNNYVDKFIKKNEWNLAKAQLKTYKNARDVIQFIGLPPMSVYVGQYVDLDGTVKDYISGSKIIIADSSVFRLGYGAIVNYEISENRPIMTDALVWEKVVNDGTDKAIYVMSRPLPYIVNNEALKILDVTIS